MFIQYTQYIGTQASFKILITIVRCIHYIECTSDLVEYRITEQNFIQNSKHEKINCNTCVCIVLYYKYRRTMTFKMVKLFNSLFVCVCV